MADSPLLLDTSVGLSELAPCLDRNGATVRAGCYGVSHGSGPLGELIRHATASWAGHAFIYIGNNQIIEGTSPVTRAASVDSHPDAVWNIREQLTDEQRLMIVAKAHALIGTPYDYLAYIGFAREFLHLRFGGELDAVFRHDKYRVCSADVADCYAYAGIAVDPMKTVVNLISPAFLYDRAVQM